MTARESTAAAVAASCLTNNWPSDEGVAAAKMDWAAPLLGWPLLLAGEVAATTWWPGLLAAAAAEAGPLTAGLQYENLKKLKLTIAHNR